MKKLSKKKKKELKIFCALEERGNGEKNGSEVIAWNVLGIQGTRGEKSALWGATPR